MSHLVYRMSLIVALFMGLVACVPDPSLVQAGVVKAPEPQIVEGVYAAKNDGTFTVPAVPVEKVPAEYQRQTVYYPSEQVVGTIIINPSTRHLYLITAKNQAIRYGISVGRDGFQWSGEAVVSSRQQWPMWTPPPEMIARSPEKAQWKDGMPGGPDNPLGARALYLQSNGRDYGYRIHGTPEWFSIGKNASSGCIRMIHQDVMDLFDRVPDGTKVIVLNADGSVPNGLNIPTPPKPKKPAVPKAAPVVPASAVPALKVLTPPVLTPASVQPAAAVAPAVVAPTVAPVTEAACKVALVNGVCPKT
jgi:lipoprotein-anchoring transpeptidase ErfK/SrfK